jgi:hypothetical protein
MRMLPRCTSTCCQELRLKFKRRRGGYPGRDIHLSSSVCKSYLPSRLIVLFLGLKCKKLLTQNLTEENAK